MRVGQIIRCFAIVHKKENVLAEYTEEKRFNYGFADNNEIFLKIKNIIGKENVDKIIQEASRFSDKQLLDAGAYIDLHSLCFRKYCY